MKFYAFSPWILQNLIWLPTRLCLISFARLKIKGLENLRSIKGGVIFALNHSSEIDAIVLPGSLPLFSRFFPMMYVSREKKFYSKSSWRQLIYGGLFFKAWGAYPVKVGLNNYEKSLETHIKLLQDGCSVCIFPEGCRTRTGFIGEAKGGVTYLSYRTGAPIVPVGVSGTFKSYLKDFFLRRKKFQISFGVAIYPRDLFRGKIEISLVAGKDDCHAAAQLIIKETSKLSGIPLSK